MHTGEESLEVDHDALMRSASDELDLVEGRDLEVDAASVDGAGKDGRVTKGDMLAIIEGGASQPGAINSGRTQPMPPPAIRTPSAPSDEATSRNLAFFSATLKFF